jgi:hypothetical protein
LREAVVASPVTEAVTIDLRRGRGSRGEIQACWEEATHVASKSLGKIPLTTREKQDLHSVPDDRYHKDQSLKR